MIKLKRLLGSGILIGMYATFLYAFGLKVGLTATAITIVICALVFLSVNLILDS